MNNNLIKLLFIINIYLFTLPCVLADFDSVVVYNDGWQAILVNNTTTIVQYDAVVNAPYLSVWNVTTQRYESYKSGWPSRASQVIQAGSGILAKFLNSKSVSLIAGTNYTWNLAPGWNLVGIT